MSTPNPIAVGGNEGVAEVIAAGTGVKGVAKGDWVIMKQPGFGTWRTHAQTDASNLVKIDNHDGLTPIQVGTVSINPCTAYRMLTGFAEMKEGDWFVQNGANSGVGRAAIQLGKLWGYKSINVVRDRPDQAQTEKLKHELKDLGADIVVTEAELLERGFGQRVKEWTNGGRERLPLALNCVGGNSATALSKLLSPSGHLVTYGAMSKQPVQLPTGLLIFKDIHFDGFWVSKWGKDHPEDRKKAVNHVLDLIRQGKFKDTPVDEVEWEWETKQDTLVKAVQGTLEGFRNGKSVFVFGRT
ncbi:mitochondrial putative trans-2-enoyl-CoA reductase [Phyllosticta citribraziliensis]